MHNPFYFGGPVPEELFLDRQREIRKIVDRLLTRGQSSAVIGEPRSGKTSLLNYLMSPQNRQQLYGEAGSRFLFQYLDAQTLGAEFSQTEFWRLALQPLVDAGLTDGNTPLAKSYATALRDQFGVFVLERLLAQVAAANWRLILVLDEFDALLYHTVLHRTEFFGGLRSLASRSAGALALVIASRQSLSVLNAQTEDLSRTGSPFFNTFQEINLGPLPERYSADLLSRVPQFSPADRRFLARLTGGHPYLLQVSASALWDVYLDRERDETNRWEYVGREVYDVTTTTMGNIWRFWTPEMRKCFSTITLDQSPLILGERSFDIDRLRSTLLDQYIPEIQILERRGFIASDPGLPSGWRITAEIMMFYVADELIKGLRNSDDLGVWLHAQQWDGLIREDEKVQLISAVRSLGGMVRDGAATFIKAVSEGFGKAILPK